MKKFKLTAAHLGLIDLVLTFSIKDIDPRIKTLLDEVDEIKFTSSPSHEELILDAIKTLVESDRWPTQFASHEAHNLTLDKILALIAGNKS